MRALVRTLQHCRGFGNIHPLPWTLAVTPSSWKARAGCSSETASALQREGDAGSSSLPLPVRLLGSKTCCRREVSIIGCVWAHSSCHPPDTSRFPGVQEPAYLHSHFWGQNLQGVKCSCDTRRCSPRWRPIQGFWYDECNVTNVAWEIFSVG